MTDVSENREQLTGRIAALSPAKRALLEMRLKQARAQAAGSPADLSSIARRSAAGPAQASFAQQRLWFLEQLDPGTPLYSLPRRIRLLGSLDLTALRQALEGLVARHDSLRTTFDAPGGIPLQVIRPPERVELPLTDLSRLAAGEREAEVRRLADAEARQPFDLARGPLMRTRLLRLAPEEHLLLLTVHHIVADGWSMAVLFRELGVLYRAGVEGTAAALPALPLQYADYAVWQRERFTGARLDRELEYWRSRFPTLPPPLQLPTDRLPPAAPTHTSGVVRFTIPAGLAREVAGLARQEGATPFMLLLGAFKALLARYTDQEDIVVGTPIAGRTRVEMEEVVGFFTNLLPLRTELGGDLSFRELLQRVRETSLGAYAHQELPFERLVEELRPARDAAHAPLFRVLFALQNAPSARLDLPGLTLEHLDPGGSAAKFDLGLTILEREESLRGVLRYDTDLFDAATAERMAGHYVELLAAAAADPACAISELPLLTSRERHELLVTWNETAAPYRLEHCVHRRFEEHAARVPQRLAAVSDGGALTYGELNAWANRLAAALGARELGPGALVPVLMEGSLEVLVSMLGVMKAGAAFVPLDVDWPLERVRRVLEELGSPVVLGGPGTPWSEDELGRSILAVDALATGGPVPDPELRVGPESPIYAIYTSGSTGTPKAALVPHRGITNRFLWMNDFFGPETASAALQTTRHMYDSAVWQLLWPLINGGKTVIPKPGSEADAEYLSELIARHEVTIADFVPSVFNVLVPRLLSDSAFEERLRPLRAVVLGGEEITPATTYRFMGRFSGVRVINLYGPTEASIGCICYEVTGSEGARIPIGRPIANVRALVLDPRGQPVPIGVPGELHLAGACVGLGYLNAPERTAAAFLDDELPGSERGKRYRTGDRVRYRADGQLEFLGRVDGQVKLRGLRVELGEIESSLAGHSGVAECAVVAWGVAGGEKRLVAYVVPAGSEPASAGELRGFLQRTLPEYMLPSVFISLARLPRLPSGKLDRRGLPAPDGARPDLAAPFEAPRTAVEELLAGIWGALLGVDNVGVNDNFFELGGHSLLATQVIPRIKAGLGVAVPLRALFEEPTIARLARLVERSLHADSGQETTPLGPVHRPDQVPLSLAQQRLWFLQRMEPESPFYSMSRAIRLQGGLDVEALAGALHELTARHETLRTTFPEVNGLPVQEISDVSAEPLPLTDLSRLAAGEREAEVRRLADAEARQPFDLARGPLMRTRLLRLAPEEHLLLLTVHHIVADGWSMAVLFRELGVLYRAGVEGTAAALPALPLQYADYAVWQRERFTGARLDRELEYWKTQLAGAPTALELPADRPRPPVQRYRGANYRFVLPPDISVGLRRLAQREGATLFMTLLAGFKALLARYTDLDDMVVGTPVAGRTHAETEGLVGCFVNTLVLRTRLGGNPTFRELVARVRETALGAYAHQELPFERLVEELQPARELSRNPLVQVVFAVQNLPRVSLDLGGLVAQRVPSGRGTAKFDLAMVVRETGDALRVSINYSTDLFDAATIERLAAHYRELMAAVVAEPGTRLAALPLLDAGETDRIVRRWNDTAVDHGRAGCVHELFTRQVERTPDAAAVVFEGKTLTYSELERRSNQLAHHLRRHGVGPDVRVGLLLERSLDLPVAVLGVLKAGGAYVPLDPAAPPARIRWAVADAGAVLVVGQGSLPSLPDGIPTVDLDRDGRLIAQESAAPPADKGTTPEHLAYVMYTSGSTGMPKGVAIPHRAVVNFSLTAAGVYRLDPADRVYHSAPLTSDFSVEELFPAWLSGAGVVLRSPGPAPTGLEFTEALERNCVSIATLPTAFWHSWVADLQLSRAPLPRSLRSVTIGGERPQPGACAVWREIAGDSVRWFNTYGPTETTVEATLHEVGTPNGGSGAAELPIGRPIANVRVYVLDRHLRPVPVGVPGEACIGGYGLARGYHGRPGLTAERFVPDPFGAPGARLYRTGDFVRYRPDGTLEFVGRRDHQVKIRGFRVELGEIEAALAAHPGVRQSAVIATEAAADRRVIAYVAPADAPELSSARLRDYLKARLPEYMLPSAFVLLPSLPRTSIGKVDRRALANLAHPLAGTPDTFVAARTPMERAVADVWCSVLGLDRVGVEDDFFALGGHSLLATKVVAHLRAALGVELPLRAFFERATVAALAERLEAMQRLLEEVAALSPSEVGSELSRLDVTGRPA